MSMRPVFFVSMALAMALVAGCASPPPAEGEVNIPRGSLRIDAPGPNPQLNTEDANGVIAGFLPGLWHGIISPVTLVLSVINREGQIYEVHNNGPSYNFGFLLGVAVVSILLGAAARMRRR